MDIKRRLFGLYQTMEMNVDTKKIFFKKVYKLYKQNPNKHIFKKLKYYYSIPFLKTISQDSVHKLFKSSRLIMIEQLQAKKHLLTGDFILKKNSYEKQFCNIMGWKYVVKKPNARYYDCTNHFSLIELKKGQGIMWFDMVRYAEIYLGIGKQHTVTVYIDYNKKKAKINEIYIIPTSRLIHFLKIDKERAEKCIEFYKEVPRGLNMQASAYKKDLKAIASKVIKF